MLYILYNYSCCVAVCHVQYCCRPSCEIMQAMAVASTHTYCIVYLSTEIDFVCVLCTSGSTAAVASLSLPLSMCVYLFKGTSHKNIAIYFSTCPYIFLQVFVQTTFIPYFHSGTYCFSICDHGPDSLHAVIRGKTITTAPQSPPTTTTLEAR